MFSRRRPIKTTPYTTLAGSRSAPWEQEIITKPNDGNAVTTLGYPRYRWWETAIYYDYWWNEFDKGYRHIESGR